MVPGKARHAKRPLVSIKCMAPVWVLTMCMRVSKLCDLGWHCHMATLD